jgi:hypothetical protein
MTQPQQIQEDLHFVRQAVTRHDQHRRHPSILWVVAAYVLIGYTLLDFHPLLASWFLGIAGVALWPVQALLGRNAARRDGEYDRATVLRIRLHWGGGISVAVVAAMALAAIVPSLRGPVMGQLIVVMIGLVYFLGGVHLDRQFLWLGPVVIAGGVLVGFVPNYGWTALGVVIAAGLVIPTFFGPHHDDARRTLPAA